MVPLQAAQKISIHALREEGDQNSRIISFHGKYFNPRPPRGGRPCPLRQSPDEPAISIHALREEGDAQLPDRVAALQKISIHALREEGDRAEGSHHQPRAGISIHALREEGDSPTPTRASLSTTFQSTPSARRATTPVIAMISSNPFQSTPSARRATTPVIAMISSNPFQSTPSARRATGAGRHRRAAGRISIHALREEGDSHR